MADHEQQVDTYMALQNQLVNLGYDFQLFNLSVMARKDVADLPLKMLEAYTSRLRKVIELVEVANEVDLDSLLEVPDEKKDDKGLSL